MLSFDFIQMFAKGRGGRVVVSKEDQGLEKRA